MKRIVLVAVAVGSMALFAACKKDNKEGEPAADEAAKATDTAADPAAAGDQPADPAAAGDTAADPAAAGDQPADPAAAGDPTAAAGEPEKTGIAECDAYISRLMTCEKYPQQAKDALKQSTDAWKQAASAGGESAKAAADACKQAEATAEETLKGLGC